MVARMLVDRVDQALRAVPLGDEDEAAKALAMRYAKAIDEGGDLSKLGPAFLACLESLGLSPRARAALKKGTENVHPNGSKLDELRARRNRKSRAETVDATAS